MASTSDTLSSSSSRFICFYGSESRYQLDSCCPTLVWYGAELNDNNNNNNKRKRESYDFGHLIQLPLFQEIVPGDFALPSTVPLGSNIYCFLSGGRRVLCLDTTRPQIGWTQIAFHMSKFRSRPLTAVADGNIYVIGGYTSAQPGPWAEVFKPCTQSWDILDHPCIDHRHRVVDRSFCCASMALDDDGLGFSRKVIVLASYYCNDIHVYDVDAKSWLLPPPPKLDSSFFYTKFPFLQPACKPVLVHKTVYWYAMPRFFCAYNVENGECSVGYFQNLELMVEKLPHNDDHSLLLLHLDGLRFCLFWSRTLLVFRSCKGPPYKVSGHNANASISVDSIHNFFPGAYGFAPEGAMIIDGKLEASKSLLVDLLPPILEDIYMGIDLPNIEIITAKEPEGTEEPEGSESKFVPILQLQGQPPNPISCEGKQTISYIH